MDDSAEKGFRAALAMNLARCEAESLFGMVKRGASVEILRELIGVPANIRGALKSYAAADPAEARWVETVLRFREAVEVEFERLVSQGSSESLGVEKTPSELAENKELADAKIGSLVVCLQTPVCGNNSPANRL